MQLQVAGLGARFADFPTARLSGLAGPGSTVKSAVYDDHVISVSVGAATDLTYDNPDYAAHNQGAFLGIVVFLALGGLFLIWALPARSGAISQNESMAPSTIEQRLRVLGGTPSNDVAVELTAKYSFWGTEAELAKTLPLVQGEQALWSGGVGRVGPASRSGMDYLRVADTHIAYAKHHALRPDGISFIPAGSIVTVETDGPSVSIQYHASRKVQWLTLSPGQEAAQQIGVAVRQLLAARK